MTSRRGQIVLPLSPYGDQLIERDNEPRTGFPERIGPTSAHQAFTT